MIRKQINPSVILHPIEANLKSLLLSRVKSPAYRVILAIANHNRKLLLLAFHGNLLSAVLEGTTFGALYMALRVLEEGSLDNVESLSWLTSYLTGWTQGQLFIGSILVAIIMQILRGSLSYGGLVASGYLQARIRGQMTEQVFRQIMSLSFPCASGYKVGDLTQYVQDSQEGVRIELEEWNQLLINGLITIAYIVVLVTISPMLSIVSLLLAGGLFGVQRYLLPQLKRNSQQVTQATVSVIEQIVESIQGLRLIHGFGRQREAITRINRATAQLVPFLEKQQLLSRLTLPLNNTLTVITISLLLIFGFIILDQQQAGIVPALFTFITALQRLSTRFGSFAGILNSLASNAGRMERLDNILQTANKEFARVGGKLFQKLSDRVCFNEVTLRYFPDQEPALQNVTFEMPRGSVTALVGESGAGKSSIADLLVGFYEPTQGSITVDSINLQDLSLESWRKHLGLVSQDSFMFNETILENIRYGQLQATEAEVREAAKAAQADQFIQLLPQGYYTVVGERGYRLSGGQRQRLALARAILKQPEILILDEATSALDSQSERLVQEALAVFQKDRTVLVVAHRLSTIVGADLILVLEQGQIVERGTHQQLLNQHKQYANYWQLQSQRVSLS